MFRSKSPDMPIEKPLEKSKSRHKNIPHSFINLSNVTPSNQFSKIFVHSNKNRISSISNNRSFKQLKRKGSLNKLSNPISKSPSIYYLHNKDENTEKSYSPVPVSMDHLNKIEEIMQKIEQKSLVNTDKIQLQTFYDEKFELYNEVFEEIIKKDKVHGKYLSMIKVFYDVYYKEKSTKQSLDLKVKMKQLEIENDSVNKEIDSLQKIFENLSKENYQLSTELEKYKKELEKAQKKLENIKKVDLRNFPVSEENYKSLIVENKYYVELCNKLDSEIKIYKHNQEMFLEKFEDLKQQGIQVVYEFSDSSLSEASSEFVLEDPPHLKKSNRIPSLNFDKLKL